ncbi:MAG TPA: nickel pincer cofactor biosynthesis protein LarB [Limnochordia bacterium]|nr:nickel pincer cofactor biosynthesis protein LarB [Limnochordia bacterium]
MDAERNVDDVRRTDAERQVGDGKLDLDRRRRRGLPEVIYCEHKRPEDVAALCAAMAAAGETVLATRAGAEHAAAAQAAVPGLTYDPVGRTLSGGAPAKRQPGPIAVISAGLSDEPVAREAANTLTAFGHEVLRVTDAGVAGLHRILARVELIDRALVAIVVAGMDGALPSVVAGLSATPVIAVPTSVGYGASFGGLSALLAMLNNCAGGATVVNIDNGFGAAYAAALIARKLGAAGRPDGAERE